jgi:hypothetical protein
MRTALTQYDTDAQDYEQVLDKNENKAMTEALDNVNHRIRRDPEKEKHWKDKELASRLVLKNVSKRLEISESADDYKLKSLRSSLKQARQKHKQDEKQYFAKTDKIRDQIRDLKTGEDE